MALGAVAQGESMMYISSFLRDTEQARLPHQPPVTLRPRRLSHESARVLPVLALLR